MTLVKQTDPGFSDRPFDAIQTDGCFFRVLLECSEYLLNKQLTVNEIKYAFKYAIPDFMEDHRQPNKDRCFISEGGHVNIIRIGFYILGIRNVSIEYKYRFDIDTGNYEIGSKDSYKDCNFWISKCKLRTTNHFYHSDALGVLLWNPSDSFTYDRTSLRGFKICL